MKFIAAIGVGLVFLVLNWESPDMDKIRDDSLNEIRPMVEEHVVPAIDNVTEAPHWWK